MNSLVSVIMPAFNCEKTISDSILSIKNQTYKNWELIISNDNSTDNTKNIILKFANSDSRIKLLDIKYRKGVSNARNTALKYAKGDYIAFLDSDDLWIEHKLEIQLKAMIKNNCYASHSSYYRIDNTGTIINTTTVKNNISYKDMLHYNHIGNLTGIYNCKILGKFYQKNIGHEDFHMWLQITKKTNSVGIEEPLAKYRVTNNSLSSNKFKCIIWHLNILWKEEKLSKFDLTFYFYTYLLRNITARVKKNL